MIHSYYMTCDFCGADSGPAPSGWPSCRECSKHLCTECLKLGSDDEEAPRCQDCMAELQADRAHAEMNEPGDP